jgi:hypothetical protein
VGTGAPDSRGCARRQLGEYASKGARRLDEGLLDAYELLWLRRVFGCESTRWEDREARMARMDRL